MGLCVSSGKQLLPLSCSLHAGVSQLASQGPPGGPGVTCGPPSSGGEINNLVRMRNQVLGQSAPSLSGLVSPCTSVRGARIQQNQSPERPGLRLMCARVCAQSSHDSSKELLCRVCGCVRVCMCACACVDVLTQLHPLLVVQGIKPPQCGLTGTGKLTGLLDVSRCVQVFPGVLTLRL